MDRQNVRIPGQNHNSQNRAKCCAIIHVLPGNAALIRLKALDGADDANYSTNWTNNFKKRETVELSLDAWFVRSHI